MMEQIDRWLWEHVTPSGITVNHGISATKVEPSNHAFPLDIEGKVWATTRVTFLPAPKPSQSEMLQGIVDEFKALTPEEQTAELRKAGESDWGKALTPLFQFAEWRETELCEVPPDGFERARDCGFEGTCAADSSESNLEGDVLEALTLLESREWAEHFAKTATGKALEFAITELHNEINTANECKEIVDYLYKNLTWDGYGYWLADLCIKEADPRASVTPVTLEEFIAAILKHKEDRHV